MKNKIEILEERLVALQNIIGDIDTTDIGSKTTGSVLFKDKMNNISDIIVRLQKEISENDSITFKDINKKFEELAPLLDVEKLKSEYNIPEEEMYALILLNEDELKNFSGNLNFIKSNANYLNFSPIVDGQEKISKIKPLELQTLNLETKVYSLNDNIDNLITNYTQSVNIINEKLAMYNEILKGKE